MLSSHYFDQPLHNHVFHTIIMLWEFGNKNQEGYIMRFEETGLEGKVIDLNTLDRLAKSQGLVLAGQWDYDRVTYDRKFENLDSGEVFYFRLQGYAVEGDVDKRTAVIKLLPPLLGKHYYPHGVEYGEGEKFPNNVVNQSKRIIEELKGSIEKLPQATEE